jgi:two-component system, cell cycle sensor histidine kinase and response regulator CckA
MAHQIIKVLLIEDNPGDARLIQEFLQEITSIQFEFAHVPLLQQGLTRLQSEHFDIILLDLFLPDSRELETFAEIHKLARTVPIIVITGLNDETLAVKAVHEGAQDYLVKGQLSTELLSRSIRYAIERKQTEQKIHEQAALLDISSDAILVQDLDSKILFWNKGSERLYGWQATEAMGKRASRLLCKDPPEEFEAAEAEVMAVGEWQGELHQVTKTAQPVIVESRWTLMRDGDGSPTSILVVNTNITDKKKLENQFLRTQRLESLGTLASGIAHDLNNILTPILATAQLLQMKSTEFDENTQELLHLLEVNAKRGASLVKQVLSFARGVEGKRTSLQIKHLIQENRQIVLETFPKSIELQTDVSPELWTVAGDATQLHQVLMNLCVNARDAMPNGGVLKITAENLMIDEAYARMNLDAKVGAHIMITVSDTGVGIPFEIVDRIFEPFFTTKEIGRGTGLGLSTVLGIVKSHGGFIEVTSQVGSGTQFKVFLPAIGGMETEESDTTEVAIGDNELILVVDDEASIREVNKASLTAYNYRVLTANDGIEAISVYAKHRNEISLVLIDIMMPSMDGATAVRTLKRINPELKVIAMSGILPSVKLPTEANSGIQGFLPKPYTAKELLKAVNDVLKTETVLY